MKYWDFDLPTADSFDLVQCLKTGQNVIANAREAKPGIVRGGSIGAIIEDRVHGTCHRKAHLRYHGIETPLDLEIELMTKQGEKQEEIWMAELAAGLPDPLVAKDQTQFECTWTAGEGPNKHHGSGSPDVVIWERDTDYPVLGLELKNLSSASKMKSVHYELRPDQTNLIQAANYSLRMGDLYRNGDPLPYQLVYTSRNIWQVFSLPEKVKKIVVEKGWDVDWKYGKPMSVLPFHRVYHLKWAEDGFLHYWTHGLSAWVPTKLNRDAIDHYYQVVSTQMDRENNLGPRPTTMHLDGSTAYSPCEYCDFKVVCDSYENLSVTEWRDHAKIFADDMWKERK